MELYPNTLGSFTLEPSNFVAQVGESHLDPFDSGSLTSSVLLVSVSRPDPLAWGPDTNVPTVTDRHSETRRPGRPGA